MTRKSWGGRREGAGGKTVDPALRAARNKRVRPSQEDSDSSSIDLTEILMARIRDVGLPDDAAPEDLQTYLYCHHATDPAHSLLLQVWALHKERVLMEWTHEAPGTRPTIWWVLDAPRIANIPPGYGAWILRQAIQPRARLGGRGEPYNPVLLATNGWYGLHTHWNPAGFDPSDPPRYESQASYLKRLGLLAAGEGLHLQAADFKPITLPKNLWPIGANHDR